MLCKDAEAKKLAIGLMSGTSADGIDAVLVEISGCSTNTHVRQMAFVTLPFTDAVRSRILQVAAGNFGGSEELCLMNFLLGKLSADACLAVCAQAGVDPRMLPLWVAMGRRCSMPRWSRTTWATKCAAPCKSAKLQ